MAVVESRYSIHETETDIYTVLNPFHGSRAFGAGVGADRAMADWRDGRDWHAGAQNGCEDVCVGCHM